MFPTVRRPAPTHPARSAARGSYSRSVIAGAIVAACPRSCQTESGIYDENTHNRALSPLKGTVSPPPYRRATSRAGPSLATSHTGQRTNAPGGQVLQGNPRTHREITGTDGASKRVLRLLPCSQQVWC